MTTGVKIADTATPLLEDLDASLLDTVKRGALKSAELTAGVLRREIMQTYPNGRGGLARSYRPSLVAVSGKKVVTGVFSDLVYAGIQNRGGVVTPRNAKALAIPLNKSIPVGKWPRHFARGELFFVKSKRGNSLLARTKGKDGIEPMFLLRKSVTIRGTNYLGRASKKASPLIEKEMGSAVKLQVVESGKKVGA